MKPLLRHAAIPALAITLAGACQSRSPVLPSNPLTRVTAPPNGAVLDAFWGTWSGTGLLDLVTNPPACHPGAWTPGVSEPVTLFITSGDGSGYAYRAGLSDTVGASGCDLLGNGSGRTLRLSGGTDEVDRPGLTSCHRRLETALWPCASAAPYVWETDTRLTITLPDQSNDSLSGELLIGLHHSLIDPVSGPWSPGQLRKTITLTRAHR